MATIREGQFYRIWPRFGKQINFQWGEIRQDTRELHPLAINEQIDITDNNQLPALAGMAYGEQSFRNRFRHVYDEVNDNFLLQVNRGTVTSPSWFTYITVDESTGKITVVDGFEANTFYNIRHPQELERVAEAGAGEGTTFRNISKLFFNVETGFYVTPIKSGTHKGSPVVNFAHPFGRSRVFTQGSPVSEWSFQHNFNFKPVMTQVYDDLDVAIEESFINKIDVSDPNIAYFYFTTPQNGSAIISTGGLGAVELRPADPFYLIVRTTDQTPALFQPDADVRFNKDQFYVDLDTIDRRATISLQNTTIRKTDIVDFKNDPFYVNDAEDVNAPGPADNDFLRYDAASGSWVNEAVAVGEINTASNLGAGEGLFAGKVGVDLQYKSIVAGSNIAFTPTATQVTISSAGGTPGAILFKDGLNSHLSTELNFNRNHFYTSTDLGGDPVLNLQPGALASSLTVQDTLGSEVFTAVDNFKVNRGDFYFTSDSAGNPILNLDIAPTAAGAQAFNDLSDVTVPSPSDEETVAYDSGSSQWVNVDRLQLGAGSTSVAAYGFQTSVNTGMFLRAGSDVGFIRGGTLVAYMTNTAITMNSSSNTWESGILRPQSGSPSTPAHSFTTDPDTGAYRAAADNYGIVTGGTERVRISNKGMVIDPTGAGFVPEANLHVKGDAYFENSHVRAAGFYLEPSADGSPGSDLSVDSINLHIIQPTVKNYVLDAFAAQGYIVDSVFLETESGSLTASFYIRSLNNGKRGVGIAGLDPLTVNTTATETLATGANVVNEHDRLILSVPAISTPGDLLGTIKLRRN
jgi:hypothetical protein